MAIAAIALLLALALVVSAAPLSPIHEVEDRPATGESAHPDRPIPIRAEVLRASATGPRSPADPRVNAAILGQAAQFDIDEWSNSLQVGERGRYVVTITNRGNTTARNAVVVFTGEGSLQPLARESAIGNLGPGRSDQAEFTFDVPTDVDPGFHSLPFVVRYTGPDGQQRTTEPLWIETVVDGRQTFRLSNVSSTLRVGDRGTITAELVNTGDRTTEGIVVTLGETGPTLVPLESTAAVDSLAPGERERVRFRYEVTPEAEAGPRLLNFRVRYRGQEDRIQTTEELDTAISVGPEQTFSIVNATSTLRVDATGTVTATVVNTGDRRVEGVVVTLGETGPTLVPRESTAAVDALDPGERAQVRFRFDVTADAEPGQRLLDFRVRYRGQDGDTRTTETIDAPVTVRPQQDEFLVTPVNATVSTGETDVVTLRVENRENQTLSDVRARLFVDDPLSADNSEAFVPTLGPNESATLRFEVTAAAGAIAKQYPLLLDFTYEDASGDSVLSDTYYVALDVVEPPPREFPFSAAAAAAGVTLLVVAGLAYWKRDAIGGVLRR